MDNGTNFHPIVVDWLDGRTSHCPCQRPRSVLTRWTAEAHPPKEAK